MEAIFDATLYTARLKVEIAAFVQPSSSLVHDLSSVDKLVLNVNARMLGFDTECFFSSFYAPILSALSSSGYR